jgi:hypothetical protein
VPAAKRECDTTVSGAEARTMCVRTYEQHRFDILAAYNLADDMAATGAEAYTNSMFD